MKAPAKGTVRHQATGLRLTRSQVARFHRMTEADQDAALAALRTEHYRSRFWQFDRWDLSHTRAVCLFERAMRGPEEKYLDD